MNAVDLAHPLWQRVRDRPDDMDARRILGDFLLERDELLGSLIASSFAGDERTCRELKRALERHLFAGMDVVATVTYAHGLPRGLTLRALRDATALPTELPPRLRHPALALLHELRLLDWPEADTRPTLRAIARTGPHPTLRRLTVRSATGHGRGHLDLLWPSVPGLRSLDLGLGEATLDTLPSGLDHLVWTHPPAEAPRLATERPRLTSLVLRGWAAHWPTWLGHPVAHRLDRLALEGGDSSVLEGVPPCAAHLTELDVSRCAVEPRTLAVLADRRRYPALARVIGAPEVAPALAGTGVTTITPVWAARSPTETFEPPADDDLEDEPAFVTRRELDELELRYCRGDITWTEYEAQSGPGPAETEDASLWPFTTA